MAYIPSKCSIEEYEQQIYSSDSKHRLYIKQGENVIENASPFTSKLTLKHRLLNNGSTTFSLSDFVSQEMNLELHDYQFESLTEEIEIQIGTYIPSLEDYVFVPLGKFIIQDNPTTDKNKTTYKLRDKSVNFDFDYNAKPLIDSSEKIDENGNKYVTKLDILINICSIAHTQYVGPQDFEGYDDKIAIYDNSIKARKYVAYIFEQAGLMPIIDRQGQLNAININNLTIREIDPKIVEKFTKGESYNVSKVVYESGELYFENGTNDNDTLYINSSNPYIENQEKIDAIAENVIGFNIDSFNTGKVLGNPTIDPWDIIQITYNNITYKTLAQHTLTFSGVMTSVFETTIKYESKQTNHTINNEEKFKKSVISELDNIEATLKTTIEKIDTNSENFIGLQNEFKQSIEGLQNNLTKVSGNNYIKDSMGVLNDGSWSNIDGTTSTFTREYAVGQSAIVLNDTTERPVIQKINCKNGVYTISFKYLKEFELATCKIKINGTEYDLSVFNTLSNFKEVINVSVGEVVIEFICDTNSGCIILDLMMNDGEEALIWSQNANETITDTVKIGKGIQVESSSTNTISRMDSDGTRVLNKTTGEVVREDTDRGTVTNEFESKSTSKVNGMLVLKVGDQVWLNGV